MRGAYDAEQIRRAEAPLLQALPEGALMSRAAVGLAATCARLLGKVYGSRVVLLVGGGNNGGDALYAGALLAARGARVDALLVSERPHPGGLDALRRAGGRVSGPETGGRVPGPGTGTSVPGSGAGDTAAVLARADLVLDGMLGIGGRGALRADAAQLAQRAQRGRRGQQAQHCPVVAVDVPSGVDASTGEVPGAAVRADVTVTFGAEKPGLVVDPGASYAGVVEVVDIGLTLPPPAVELLQAGDVRELLPRPSAESDKYRRGVLGLVAGSQAYPGAAVLATGGALRAGVGMVRFVGESAPADFVRRRWPETVVTEVPAGDGAAVLGAGQVQAWALGPGMGTGDDAARVLAPVLATDLPVVLDADAITVLARHPDLVAGRSAPTLLTPHAGELSRLLDAERSDIEARRLEHARRAAAQLGVTVLLKGSTTVVAAPDGRVRVNPTGTPWLATAGSGDVLTGIAGTLLAGGLDALDAGSVAAWLHGLAGRLAAEAGSPSAQDVLDALPRAVSGVSGSADPA